MDKFLFERYALKVGHDAGSPLIVTDRREVRGYSQFLFDHIVSFSLKWLVPGLRFRPYPPPVLGAVQTAPRSGPAARHRVRGNQDVEAVPQVVADIPHRRCLEIATPSSARDNDHLGGLDSRVSKLVRLRRLPGCIALVRSHQLFQYCFRSVAIAFAYGENPRKRANNFPITVG